MAESRQRTVAAFSLGLGIGLAVTGAPRLLVLGSLAPALVVAATLLAARTAASPEPDPPPIPAASPDFASPRRAHRRPKETSPMLAEAIRPIGAALDPERIRRAAGDIQPPDTQQLVRSLQKVPDRLDEVFGEAGTAIREALQQLPDRLPDQVIDRLPEPVADRLPIEQRRGPGKAQLAFLVGGLVAIGVAGWLAFRLRSQAALRAEEARLEQAALDRAADEGMDGTTVLGAEASPPCRCRWTGPSRASRAGRVHRPCLGRRRHPARRRHGLAADR